MSYEIRDVQTGEVLAARAPDTLVTPASTMKVLTTAAVFARLPRDTRWSTQLYGPEPDDQGVMWGDLWLVGGGDPSFGAQRFKGRGDSHIEDTSEALTTIAQALVARGVRVIRGDVLGDGRLLEAPRLGDGWSWDDALYSFSARPSALVYRDGLTRLRVTDRGGRVEHTLEPPTHELHLQVVRRPAPPSALLLVPGADSGDGVARWWGPDDDGQRTKSVATPNPPAYAAEQLLAALRSAGIEVIGTARHVDPSDPSAPTEAPLHTVPGPTTQALVTETNHASVNLYAEVLLMQLGRIAGEDATTYGGLDVLRGYLEEIGFDPKRVRLADGSGLSRMGLLSASCLTAVLADAVRRDPAFADTLSAAQGRGTMRGRLPEHPDAHRVRAKTGSLTGHRNLAGLIDKRYAFAFLASGTIMSRSAVDRAVDAALTVALDQLP